MGRAALLLDAVPGPAGGGAESSLASKPTSGDEDGITGGAVVEGSDSITSESNCAVAVAGCCETVDIRRNDNASVVMNL